MEPINVTKEQITLSFFPDEVGLLFSAIAESVEAYGVRGPNAASGEAAIKDSEYQARAGESRQGARDMMAELNRILRETKLSEWYE